MRRAAIMLLIVAWLSATRGDALRAQSKEAHDTYYLICEINKASIVMLAETGIVPRPLAARIAKGIREVIVSLATTRPNDYFDFEPKRLATDTEWLKARRQRLRDAQAALDKAFNQLVAESGS